MAGVSATKTGAVVRFSEYRTSVAADLYIVGDCVVIVRNPIDSFYTDCNREPTHQAWISSKGYCNADKTVIIVPYDQITNIEVDQTEEQT